MWISNSEKEFKVKFLVFMRFIDYFKIPRGGSLTLVMMMMCALLLLLLRLFYCKLMREIIQNSVTVLEILHISKRDLKDRLTLKFKVLRE